MSLANHYQFSAFVTAFLNLILFWLVVKKGAHNKLTYRFSVYCGSIIIWSLFVTLSTTTDNPRLSLIFSQICHAGATLIPVYFYHFVCEYLELGKKPRSLKIAYIVAPLFLGLIIFSPQYFFDEVSPKLGFPYFPNDGLFYIPWTVYFFVVVSISLLKLFSKYLSSKDIRRKQIRFFLLANVIGYSGGIGCFLPVFDINIFPFPYGPYGVALFSLVTAFTILRYKFLDIEVIIKKTLVFAGLFGMVMAVVAIMSGIINGFFARFFNVPPNTVAISSALLVMIIFDPMRRFLTEATDRYLFQKRQGMRAILKDLAEKVVAIVDLKQIGQVILSTLVDTFRLESGMVVIYDRKDQKYRLLENLGVTSEEVVQSVRGYVYESNIQEYLKHHSIVSLDDPSSEELPNYMLEWMKMAKGRVCIPLFIDADQGGFLIFGKKKSDQKFIAEETDYFPTIASQTELAIRNACLIETVVQEREAKVRAEHLAKRVEFAGLIKHEIQNKLVHIEMPANASATYCVPCLKKSFKEQDEERFIEMCDEIAEGSKKINFAANQIRVIAQTAKGGIDEKDKSVMELDCKVIWEDAKKESGLLKRCDFESKMPNGFFVYGNYHALQRVFVNLITNAYDAMKDKDEPLIKMRCSYENIEGKRVAHFQVEDSGCGIPKEIQKKIFENGFSTKPKPDAKDLISSGHGQGLAACKLYIENIHDGRIWVESEVGKGATFKFWIPANEDNGKNNS